MRLEPLEIYILDCFREHHATQLPISDIVGDSTVNRFDALADALQELESEHGMLQRAEQKNVFELTDLGKKYTGI